MTTRKIVLLGAALMLALAPALAEARAKAGGGSIGSRGARTYNTAPSTPTAPQAAPMERSMTQPQAAPRPATQPAAQPAGVPAAQPGFFGRNPFMTGLMGGLLGAGIGGMLFGGGFFGGGALGGAGMLGLLLQLALIGGLIYFAMRLFRGRQQPTPAMAGGPAYREAYNDTPRASDIPAGNGGGGFGASDAVAINEADYQAFEQTLSDVQAAWSKGDLGQLKKLATPEMLSYFAEELAAQASQGVTNHVEAVKLEQGDLAEAWREGGTEYATVAMRWSMLDYTLRDDGSLTDGSKTERVEATEIWTFMRSGSGKWLLSAIQQPQYR